ncbi:predicted protein [Naegleria gruberi]|uniref:Predicted protein n=1 Tax=Naegleria gruberi TaxID=5762 RepID=D2V392_NAEGR|nr:uncharacterized protein NAEGRDRAFT_63273 [Naegleria gruberi]EFC48596.1 predicted protein [Naegleria gruberi]|eukprot:XP_002681340.1 predicted protein [Naegleria gruberi strain NEG-M]
MLKRVGLAWTQALVPENLLQVDLKGKICLVTGSTVGGIGYETAKKMYELGCNVILVCRSEKNGKEARDLIQQECSARMKQIGTIDYILMDLDDLESVNKVAKQFKEKFTQLDFLFNNAGVMFCPHSTTTQGVEIQFGTNYLGHFLLTLSLMDLIKKVNGRIINVSSIGSKAFVKSEKDITNFCSFSKESVMGDCENVASKQQLYGRSKLAQVLFSRKLAREFKSSYCKVTSYSLHPGAVKTNLERHTSFLFDLATIIVKPLYKTPYEGAQTSLYVALAPISELENGGYYSECSIDEASQFADRIELQDTLWDTSMKLVEDYL